MRKARQNWTADDSQRLRRLVASGLTDTQIGEDMKRHPKFIGQKRRQLEVPAGMSAALNAMMMRIRYRRRLQRA